MRVISADELDRVFDFPLLVAALRSAFARGAIVPERHHHSIGGRDGTRPATHLLMPAWSAEAPGPGAWLGTKIVSVFPDNARFGLPAVLGVYILQSGESGAPVAVLDGTRLTHWRTAAASALAADLLARRDAGVLLIVGSGALAPFLARAHASVRALSRVLVWNHRAEGAERLAAGLNSAGVPAEAAPDLEAAVRSADVISCATLSEVPLLRGDWLRPGQHLDLVGAFTMTMRESDDAVLRRARIYVDTPAALHEGGDVALGIRDGVLQESDVVADLAALCRGDDAGRRSDGEITLFKSVGTALEDLAAAAVAWERVGAQ